VLAVNKIDLVDYSAAVFERIADDFRGFAARLQFETLVPIPLSARYGDNVIERSERTPWYPGPSLLDHLENVDVEVELGTRPFRLHVQWVNRPNLDFRGYAGTIASGSIRRGEEVISARSGRASRVASIVDGDGDLEFAAAGQAVSLTLTDEIDVSRGDVLATPGARPEVADQVAAHVLWMAEDEMLPHRQYLVKIGTETVAGQVTALKHKVDVNTLEHVPARTLSLNEIGYCNLSLSAPVAFDPYRENRDTGSFIVIDRMSNRTVGAGMIEFGLRRATNVRWQALDVDAAARAGAKGQKPCVLWFTGLSASGKSTIANLVEKRLFGEGRHTYLLDGDNVRHGLNRDLGFTDVDRVENIRRVAEVAKLMADAGLIAIVSFISPFRAERRMARDLLKREGFVEIFVDTPVDLCIARDPKGLYKRAMAGQIKNFTGIDSAYEPPENPELVLETERSSAEELAERVIAYLRTTGRVP
jgi:bifunctional enzyme CysN/CysC